MQGKNNIGEKKISGVGAGVVLTKQLYEGNVAARAIKRAGKNKNLKGHIFEHLTIDKINRKPLNILKGKKAVLAKSPTAVRDDILIKQGGKIVKRMQLKDTPKGIKDTVSRVANKQYTGTNLIGTKETVKAYGEEVAKRSGKGTKITQKMTTNGISSKQTEVIAAKALGGNVAKHSGAIMGQACKTGVKTAVISFTASAVSNTRKVVRKEMTIKKAVGNVAKDGAVDAASAVVGDMVGTGVTIAVASTPAAPLAGAAGAAAGVGATMVTDKMIRNMNFSKTVKNVKRLRKKNYHKINSNSKTYSHSYGKYGQPAIG